MAPIPPPGLQAAARCDLIAVCHYLDTHSSKVSNSPIWEATSCREFCSLVPIVSLESSTAERS